MKFVLSHKEDYTSYKLNTAVVFLFIVHFSGYLYKDLFVVKSLVMLSFGLIYLYDLYKYGIVQSSFIVVFLLSIFLPLISLFSGKEIDSLFFCFTILLGYLVSYRVNELHKASFIFVILNLFAMLYEYISLTYLLPPTADSFYFSGRAKGLFSYSKEYGGFLVVFACVFYRKNTNSHYVLLLLSSLMTGSRLPMLIILFLWFSFNSKDVIRSITIYKFFLIILIILGIGVTLSILSEHDTFNHIILRLYDSFNADSSSNSLRLYFWSQYLDYFYNYDFLSLIFGNPGYVSNIVGNGAESAWLSLITDGGLYMLIGFMLCVLILIFNRNSFNSVLSIIVLAVSMQISRINLGYYDGLIFWAVVFFVLNKNSKLEPVINE